MDCRALTLSPRPSRPTPSWRSWTPGRDASSPRRPTASGGRVARRPLARLGVPSLRDTTLDAVAELDDDVLRRRARHVVTENERTLAAADALTAGDAVEFGRLMTASHLSLRDDYEVSGPGLDRIVDVALDAPGCLGARMTGGGFAGCAVALVRADDAGAFRSHVVDHYRFEEHRAQVWLCHPAAGAVLGRPRFSVRSCQDGTNRLSDSGGGTRGGGGRRGWVGREDVGAAAGGAEATVGGVEAARSRRRGAPARWRWPRRRDRAASGGWPRCAAATGSARRSAPRHPSPSRSARTTGSRCVGRTPGGSGTATRRAAPTTGRASLTGSGPDSSRAGPRPT